MASPPPTFQTLTTVETFRELVNRHFAKEIADGEEFDARDIQRFNEIDEYTVMFIQHGQFGTSFDEPRALAIFKGAMSWRKRHNVYDISTDQFPANFFDRGAVYFKNHDIKNNPILHFVVRNFAKGQDDNEAVKRFITYNFERHVRRNPGQHIVILFDMSETGLRHIDFDIVKFLIGSIQIFYPGLLAYMLIFKMPFLLWATWKLIRTWLPAEADQFIKFVDVKSITQFVRSDQLSTSMGGTDATNYVHVADPINDAVEDSMHASLKKKVTFADANSLEPSLPPSPMESTRTSLSESEPRTDSTSISNQSTSEQPNISLTTTSNSPDLSQSIARKSILQKPALLNGYAGDERVIHGLLIRPCEEIIFEKVDSPSGTADSVQTLTLTNMGDKILTFKIKTTSPDKFRVKPGCSVLLPGASISISVYLLKAYCTSSNNVQKEKFLVIWTLLSQELKQAPLLEFWKTVPSSVLHEHRLKCSLDSKQPSPVPANETTISRPSTTDNSMVEMQKTLNESLTLQRTTMMQTSKELAKIRQLLLVIFLLLTILLLWDMSKYFFSSRSSSLRSNAEL